jgi:predicted nucleic acid-binding protein
VRGLPESLRKIVIDTSALISLTHGDLLDLIADEFHLIISDLVLEELRNTAKFEDEDGKAAAEILKKIKKIEIRKVDQDLVNKLITSRIDAGEASCVVLAQANDIAAFISDDFRAMHELRVYALRFKFELGLGAVLIQALVFRGKITKAEALNCLSLIASKRNWMGRPIYEAYSEILGENTD